MAVLEFPSVVVPHAGLALFERVGGRTIVSLVGEHDAFTAPQLCEVMAGAIALDRADLVVDLSRVEFMGVATVTVIVHTIEDLARVARSLVVRSPSMRARRVLELCGVDPLIESS